ncbi:phosphoribosylamine--glycine ligase [Candidatus Margulisiibacteriota bacterium]
MKVLVVGSGGREHTLVWKISQSLKVKEVYCVPGNAGISELAECVDIKADDIPALKNFALKNKIDLTIVGPEIPLVAGLVDEFNNAGLNVFGPTKKAAQLEGSKLFAKKIMEKYGVPTGKAKEFTDEGKAVKYLQGFDGAVVVKADGLAAGKGVIICKDHEEAEEAVHQMLGEKMFGEASSKIIIEEYLEGEEASILAFSDGDNFAVMDSSQDHKRVSDNDMGPNTGGMGAYSPAPIMTSKLMKEVEGKVFKRMIDGMKKEGIPFVGILYAGLMINKNKIKVLEFNVRFGDPETQALLPRLKTDLIEVIEAANKKQLNKIKLEWDKRPAVCVVMASGGYPGKYEKGKVITGLDDVKGLKDVVVFHAGTSLKDGKIITSGGRVLGVTALADSVGSAIAHSYGAVRMIKFDKAHYRSDIGKKALDR